MAISAELGSQLEAFVTQLVESGRYNSKSEVLREGVRIIQDRETKLVAMHSSIKHGLADADADTLRPMEDVFDELDSELAEIEQAELE